MTITVKYRTNEKKKKKIPWGLYEGRNCVWMGIVRNAPVLCITNYGKIKWITDRVNRGWSKKKKRWLKKKNRHIPVKRTLFFWKMLFRMRFIKRKKDYHIVGQSDNLNINEFINKLKISQTISTNYYSLLLSFKWVWLMLSVDLV